MTPPFITPAALAALADRWRARGRCVVMLGHFGDGRDFLTLRDRWRADPHRPERLHVIALAEPARPPAPELADQWPVATPDLHLLRFDDDRVQLQLAFGDPRRWWRELAAEVDAFWLDGAQADPFTMPKALMRLSAPLAEVHLHNAPAALLAGLRARGFDTSGHAGEHATAVYRPSFTPRRAPSRSAVAGPGRHALVIGGGLAGAAAARALARQGWHSTVIDRHPAPASEASGNPAGLFHGIVTADDGPHARFNRAASFEAARAVADAVARHGVAGSSAGLLRLANAEDTVPAMAALLAKLALPAGYVQAVDATEASRLAGVPLAGAAWWYPQGGWVDPAGLVRAMLADAGSLCTFRGGTAVHRIVRHAESWQAEDAAGEAVAAGDVVVLANAHGAAPFAGHADWPLQRVRGQLSSIELPPGVPAPQVPIAGGGYVMPVHRGRVLFGATAQAGDGDGAVRAADHALNVAQLNRLLGSRVATDDAGLAGRTAWRCVSSDRLPLVGAVVREPGLYVLTGLGSRGITWSALAGEVVASMISGAPAPVSIGLLDALDPARFLTRALRRGKPTDRASAE